MSDQEKTNDGKEEESSVVVVEKAHHKPFNPTDVEDTPPNPPLRRTRAPVAPDVVEDLKLQEESNASGAGVESLKERTESKALLEKLKLTGIKKLSSTKIGQKSETQIETVSMVHLEIETKKSVISQPIPAAVSSLPSTTASTKLAEPAAAVEDAIDVAQDIEELRVQEPVRARSEWVSLKSIGLQTPRPTKKEISWNSRDYLEKISLKEAANTNRATSIMLERKASVGPCKSRTPFAAPSGLLLCVPKKSTGKVSEYSTHVIGPVINISISKNFLSGSKTDFGDKTMDGKRAVKVDPDIPYIKTIITVKSQIDFIRGRIQHIFNY